MNGFIEYNKHSVCIEIIEGKKAIKFVSLTYLTGRCSSYLYSLKQRKLSTISQYLIKKQSRSLYITLEGCVKFLSLMYMPEDGLINEFKRELNKSEAVHVVDGSIVKGEKSFSTQLFKEDGIEGKLDELNRMVRTIGVTLQNINGMLYEQMNKKDDAGKPMFKDMLKEFLKEVLNG